ncbi:MAG: hypothetical protein WAZ30_06685, partial [Syntrophorhabdus sp.]
DRRQISRYFYLDRNPMEEMLVEIFGCIALDNKVILLDFIRDRKRSEREYDLPMVATESSTEWLKRMHDRLS